MGNTTEPNYPSGFHLCINNLCNLNSAPSDDFRRVFFFHFSIVKQKRGSISFFSGHLNIQQ